MAIKAKKLKGDKTAYEIRVQHNKVRIKRVVRTTLTKAKRIESEILQKLISGEYESLKRKENPLFRDYTEEYLKDVHWQKSFRRTKQLVELLAKEFGNKRLTEITTKDFLRYRARRTETVSNATFNREHSCLQRMLNVAISDDGLLISKNPLRGIKKLPEAPVENRELTPEEYQKLLKAAPEYFRRIMFFACNVGTRLQETLSLQFKQVKIHDFGAEVELIETKSGKRETVPINEGVVELLDVIARQRGIDFRFMSEQEREQYVFLGLRGERLKSVRKPMQRTFRDAGVPYRDFHTFRHFWTTEMFNAGADVLEIQKIGRWGDLKTMLRYCHKRRTQEYDAVNKLHQHLSSAAEILPFKKVNSNN
ncbi:MAG: tyrosine-type recombinase/integrase [Aliifodinibius sp.]|nr:tyrosine-type recombinase/integrase [Fodinibius sp.]NIV14530.1 tyrosine-type recombinase/integrase [Fodinibius sp.]NIY28372.1 tyrosine-type recombinase/integrase [Fodinibius sp.]